MRLDRRHRPPARATRGDLNQLKLDKVAAKAEPEPAVKEEPEQAPDGLVTVNEE